MTQNGSLQKTEAISFAIGIVLCFAIFWGAVTYIAEGNRHKNEKMWGDCIERFTPPDCERVLKPENGGDK